MDLPSGPLLRLKMVKLLQLMKRVSKEIDETNLNEIQAYQLRKSVADAYEKMIQLLVNDFTEEKFINSSTFMNILLELKSQVRNFRKKA